MARASYRLTVAVLLCVVGILLYLLAQGVTDRQVDRYRQEQLKQEIRDLRAQRDSLVRVSDSLSLRTDSLRLLVEQSEQNTNRVKERYERLRNNLRVGTTDDHILFLTEQLPQEDPD